MCRKVRPIAYSMIVSWEGGVSYFWIHLNDMLVHLLIKLFNDLRRLCVLAHDALKSQDTFCLACPKRRRSIVTVRAGAE